MTQHSTRRNGEEERFLAYLDDECTQHERRELKEELEGDSELKGRFEQYKKTVELLRKLKPAKAPEDLLENVQKRITRRPLPRPTPHIRFPFELVAVMLVLVGVLYTYFVWVPGQPAPILKHKAPPIVRVELYSPLLDAETRGLDLEPYGRTKDHRRIYTTISSATTVNTWLAKRPEAIVEPVEALERSGRIKLLVVAPAKSIKPEGM